MPPKKITFTGAQQLQVRDKSGLGFNFTTPIYSDADKQAVLGRVKEIYAQWKNGQINLTDDDGHEIGYEYAKQFKGGASKGRGIIMRRVWSEMRASKGDMWAKGANQPEQIRHRRSEWCATPVTDCINDCTTSCNRKWTRKDKACDQLRTKGKISARPQLREEYEEMVYF